MWLGHNNGAQEFIVPDSFERNNVYVKNGSKYAKFGNICWFTNLETLKRHEELMLYKDMQFDMAHQLLRRLSAIKMSAINGSEDQTTENTTSLDRQPEHQPGTPD